MDNWSWFTIQKQNEKLYNKPLPINYDKIAMDKKRALEYITKNPDIMFMVVDEEVDCMCGGTCGSCTYIDVTFFELIIRYKTLTEIDLLSLSETISLNWFKISSLVPLSNSTIEKYKDQLDWESISKKQYLYTINAEFIKLFGDKLNWSLISSYSLELSSNELEEYTFINRIIPIKNAILTGKLNLDTIQKYIQKNIDEIAPFCDIIISTYGAKKIEDLVGIEKYVQENAQIYIKKCIWENYISEKYGHLISNIKSEELVNDFIKYCKPDVDFLEKYIVPNISDNMKHIWILISSNNNLTDEFIFKFSEKLNWPILMKWKKFDNDVLLKYMSKVPPEILCKYQKLSTEFIDEHLEKLDWYNLCEYQDLPEEFIIKHKDKINWGQVSRYQKMSLEFIQEHKRFLNEVKLEQNDKIKNIRQFIRV
jgi:hypothetical protein